MPFPRLAGLAALALASLATPASAQSLVTNAIGVVSALERATGMPIAILERTGDDPGAFWYSAMQTLCSKTGDNWCEGDVQVLSDTTNLLGWARVLTYTPQGSSTTKRVCAILPPQPGVSAGYVATGLAGGGVFSYRDLPSQEEAEAYLYLIHAAACMSSGQNAGAEQQRSDAFATLTLTLMEGDQSFLSGSDVSAGRKFAAFRNAGANGWAAGVGERILIDYWKGQVADNLRNARGCNVTVVASQSIDTQSIQRDPSLSPLASCGSNSTGTVSDSNLWLWGQAGSIPSYGAFASFGSMDDGVKYAWGAAGSISGAR